MVLQQRIIINAALEDVFAFFSQPGNLARITPPSLGFRIIAAPDRGLRQGDRITYRIRVAGLPVRWVTLITDWVPNVSFTDTQEKGPYKTWIHFHRFTKVADGVLMEDRVDYELPFGRLGEKFGGWFVRAQLRRIFDYRTEVIRSIFET